MGLRREEGPEQCRYEGVVQGEACLCCGGTAWRPRGCRGQGHCLGSCGKREMYQEAVNPQPEQEPAAYFCLHR